MVDDGSAAQPLDDGVIEAADHGNRLVMFAQSYAGLPLADIADEMLASRSFRIYIVST